MIADARERLSRFVQWRRALPCALLLVYGAPAIAIEAQSNGSVYTSKLGVTPVPDGVKSALSGTGTVRATLIGRTLAIVARISGVNGRATDAHLMRGAGIGIPGLAVLDLPLAADGGGIEATVQLSRNQVAALRAGQLYLQMDSDKAPAPAGHLWGWLLPAHAAAAEDEPQAGPWFLPQGAGLKAHAGRTGSGR